jgi:hypothetical protein
MGPESDDVDRLSEHLQNFILLRAQAVCNKPRYAKAKEACLSKKIGSNVDVAKIEKNGEENVGKSVAEAKP